MPLLDYLRPPWPTRCSVQVEGCRQAIEDSFETAKTELGLDHNETRSWHDWQRHVSPIMPAFAMMASIRHYANQPAPQKHRRACPGPRNPRPWHTDPHPPVGPGTPTHRHTPGPATHPARPHRRLVALATRAPGRRATLVSETKAATVMPGGGRSGPP